MDNLMEMEPPEAVVEEDMAHLDQGVAALCARISIIGPWSAPTFSRLNPTREIDCFICIRIRIKIAG